jgi:predicted GIY-YIG superfamily endonuclease
MTGFDPTGRTVLYRLYDSAGVLLYVGVTGNLATRLASHAKTQKWWPEVSKRELVWYDQRREAEAAERSTIAQEQPLWNVRESPWRSEQSPTGVHVIIPKPRPISTGGSRHANPGLTTRPPQGVQTVAKAALAERGREMEAFITACLTAFNANPDRFLADLARHWPEPRPRGRPKRATPT